MSFGLYFIDYENGQVYSYQNYNITSSIALSFCYELFHFYELLMHIVHSFQFLNKNKKKKHYTPTRYNVSSCIEKTLFSSQLDTMYRVDV